MELKSLDELIEMPKKTDASKTNKKLYTEQMNILLTNEGFSKTAIKYLKSGFSFSGAKPVAMYLQKLSIEERTVEVSKLLKSELFSDGDKLISFRYGMSLAAYSIEWFGEDQQLLLAMIKILPFVSKNKEKKLLKDAPKIFEKYFLDIVSEDTELPCIDITQLKDIHVSAFKQMMLEISGSVSSKYRRRADRITEWIGGTNCTIVEQISQQEMPKEIEQTNRRECADKNVADAIIPEKEVVALTKKELFDAVGFLSDFSSRLEVTVAGWNSTQKELEKAKKHINNLEKKLQQSKKELDNEKKKTENISCELECRSQRITELQAQLIEARGTTTELKKMLEEVTAENVRLNSIISVYSSDKQNSQSEQLNSIASKLKSEYMDFKDVECEEMTIDLGENFRFQLQSVFRILAKAGIDIEGR